ncbi:MAG: RES family NAD+ phosphorylase [Chroococcidiopsidaceae cyanobacterium CP_BM_ER_R8_30]|nr:RES family NAD+ phosphorylase [Chroococcidiopsidaceae cyanobacterium CP_BM_ER_R8_30]
MVRIAAPPPERPPSPIFYIQPAGSAIVRIFDPTRHNTTALTFRHFGPLARFDHQRASHPQDDPERGVYYCAPSFSSCLVEVFGDTGIIEIGFQCVCYPQVIRELKLLDLRGSGAMKAGSVAALSKVAERSLSQAWSRYFYEHQEIYTAIDGILYYNAHNDEEAIVLYERAKNGLTCSSKRVLLLGNLGLLPFIQRVALDNDLIFEGFEK